MGLDSSNALLRTYLGRAYFEERREALSADQYELAKELDPLDPTAYLYDAIRLQTINRPVEALRQLDRSIELNDNRAVYRSRLLLDSDRAARGASLARIYQDLDFLDTGVREATNSLTLDPTNPSAHRFLADIYGGVRRREIARVSEVLQSQMLQDLSTSAIPAALNEANLNIVSQGGPTTPGYNEFTPLFQSNGVEVGANGVLGNNETRGIEGTAAVLDDRFAISASGFAYDTNGWRANGDIHHTIGNVFFQTAITPELNGQLEFRSRRTHYGDIEQVWNPDDFSPVRDRDIDQDSYRAGLRWSPTPNSDLLLSMIYSDTNDKEDLQDIFEGLGVFDNEFEFDDKGYQPEAQYIYRGDRYNVVGGGAYFFVDREQKIDLQQNGEPLGSSDEQLRHHRPEGLHLWQRQHSVAGGVDARPERGRLQGGVERGGEDQSQARRAMERHRRHPAARGGVPGRQGSAQHQPDPRAHSDCRLQSVLRRRRRDGRQAVRDRLRLAPARQSLCRRRGDLARPRRSVFRRRFNPGK